MTIDCRERGQLLLVLATFIALTIMSSVVLLNAFYAPADVGATTERTGLSEADATTQEVSGHLHELYLRNSTNETEPVPVLNKTVNTTTGNSEVDRFESLTEQYGNNYTEVAAQYETGAVTVTFDRDASADEGFVLRQNNSERLTRNGNGNGNNHWVVVENAERVPYIYMNITETDFPGGPPGNNIFTMHMNSPDSNDPDGAEYNLTIVKNATDGVDVIVNGQRVCQEGLEAPFEIELASDGTDIGQAGQCENVNSPTYGSFNVDDVNIDNGGRWVKGNYSVVAIGSFSPSDTDFDTDPSAGRTKHSNNLIFDPHFRITYVGPGVQYHANVTALGGEA